ncbi:major histocompatibility complex class I-related gene protein-like, partial [Leuresthes tenuis]|uniref:major histocompatibility complex class I-related gene protein-like n=1 Tax=Leuresthes tenuis TaxID=355514 RepID=UPI003B50078A
SAPPPHCLLPSHTFQVRYISLVINVLLLLFIRTGLHEKIKHLNSLTLQAIFIQSYKNKMKMILLLLFCHISSAVKLTASGAAFSGVPNFPDFMGNTELDETQIDYCDSNNNRRINPLYLKRMSAFFREPFLDIANGECFHFWPPVFKNNIDTLKALNPDKAVHILQGMIGCESNDETGEIIFFVQSAYNGEALLQLDLRPFSMYQNNFGKNFTWIAHSPLGAIIKPKWDIEEEEIAAMGRVIEICNMLLQYHFAFDHLLKPVSQTDLTSVSLLQKTPSSPVTCHATGFYSKRVLIFWRRDGEEIHEHVEHGEIFPNNDGTFQMSVEMNVSSTSPEDWERYDCVFQCTDTEKTITVRLEKAVIRSNRVLVSPSRISASTVIAIVEGLLLLLVVLCISGFFIRRRHLNASDPSEVEIQMEASTATSEDNSEHQMKL